MTFIKINKGDIVYDRQQKIVGVVHSINKERSEATIDTTEDNSTHVCNLFNLTVLEVSKIAEEEEEEEEEDEPIKIKIKYFNRDSTKLTKITQGDWIDLRVGESVDLKKGDFKLIPLGVAIELPKGYEAHVAPRGSTFKNFGVIETNSVGVVDESYKGDNDQWFMPVLAMRDTIINFDERICQFRIIKKMPEVEFEEVEVLGNDDRGSHGSTGIK